MKRDYAQFPNDDNGDVLWHLHSKGDALTEPREIDFTVILPSEEWSSIFVPRIA
jgi:Regulator of ribonuclease activity B